MKYPKLRELKEAIRALIKGPYTSKFPYRPHEPYEGFRGRPKFHQDDCIGCGACFQVCPSGAIEMRDINGRRVLTVHWDLCIFCGQCQANCLTAKGIILSRDFDLATTESRHDLKQEIQKELVLCGSCQEPIVPYDQIAWVAKRLGPLVFSNPSLLLFYLRSLNPAFSRPEDTPFYRKSGENFAIKEGPSFKGEAEFTRSDRIKILCPSCRRQAAIKS